MPTQDEVQEAKRAAELALYKKVEQFASGSTRFDQLEWAARAFRATAGGAQPFEVPAGK